MTTHYRASCPAHDFKAVTHHLREDAQADLDAHQADLDAHKAQVAGAHPRSGVLMISIDASLPLMLCTAVLGLLMKVFTKAPASRDDQRR